MAEWIPTSERLPERGQTVLVCTDYAREKTDFWCGTFSGSGAKHPFFENSAFDFFSDARYVTAWMPLPEPYKEDA